MFGGGVCGRMPKHFRDLEKMLVRGRGYAQIFYRLEKCWGGGMPTNLCWGGRVIIVNFGVVHLS